MVLSVLLRLLLGVFVGGVIGALVTGDWIYLIVWAVALSLIPIVAMIGGLRRTRARLAGASEFALARVETVQRTGQVEAGGQEVDMRLTVAPSDEPAYATTMRTVVPADDLRRFTAGTVIVVARAGAERPDVSIVSRPSEAWAALAARAQADPSAIAAASVVPAWETATTTTPGTRKPKVRRRASAGMRVLAWGLIAVGAALTLIPAYPAIGRTVTNVATGDWDGNSLVSGNYQQLAIDEIANVVGGYEFRNIYFFDDYVIVSAPTRPGADTTDSYMWRYGRAFRDEPELIQPTDLEAELFDAEGLDFSMVATVVEASLADTHLDGQNRVIAYVVKDDGRPVINVSLSGTYKDAYFSYDFDGRELSRSGSAFD